MIVSPHEQANNPTSRGQPTQKTEPKIPQSLFILWPQLTKLKTKKKKDNDILVIKRKYSN